MSERSLMSEPAPGPADQEEVLARKAMNRARLEASSRMDLPDGRTRYEPGFPEQTLYGQLAAAIATLRAERDQLASELREAREALQAMFANYGPPEPLLWSLEYPVGHPISLARAALSDPRQSPAKGDDHHG